MLNRRQFLQSAAAATGWAIAGFPSPTVTYADAAAAPWRGVHVMASGDGELAALRGELPKLADLGVNLLIVEVGFSFAYQSHPELANEGGVTRDAARVLAKACHDRHIRLMPLFDCLGHQSWEKNTFPLLRKYPELDETPGQFPDNKGIYCRSWCPRNPQVMEIVAPMLDELAEAFDSDAIHVEMDEVFLISSKFCPRCHDTDPADSFARAVNDLHAHLTGKRKRQMLMWSDRLIDGKATGLGKWEASENGTFPAIDHIPKDIVQCPWHYNKRDSYPSIPLLLNKGFGVLPSSWHDITAADALIDYAAKHAQNGAGSGGRLLGHLCTTWGKAKPGQLADWPPIISAMKKLRGEKSGG